MLINEKERSPENFIIFKMNPVKRSLAAAE